MLKLSQKGLLFRLLGGKHMKKYSVIRVSRKQDAGQACTVEITFDNFSDAQNFAFSLNRLYSSNGLNWVVDQY